MAIDRETMIELATLVQAHLGEKGRAEDTQVLLIALHNVQDNGEKGFVGDQSYISSLPVGTAISVLEFQLARLKSMAYAEEKTEHLIVTPVGEPSNKSRH